MEKVFLRAAAFINFDLFLSKRTEISRAVLVSASTKIDLAKNKTHAPTQKIDPEKAFGYKCARHEDYGS